MESKMKELIERLEKLEEYCEQNSHLTFYSLYNKIMNQVRELNDFAMLHELPLKIDAHDLVNKHIRKYGAKNEVIDEGEDTSVKVEVEIDESYQENKDSYEDYEDESSYEEEETSSSW
ncbi:gp204 [Bacillus phage G]|uniref:Gp204 n=1 Tax=Bacillus phage G TaxID=2884420 RepID=G3MBS0_9CAUD|nr:gp204 [Bacillus phage G]AEO93463.1 gp204 [Bacillus phage G]